MKPRPQKNTPQRRKAQKSKGQEPDPFRFDCELSRDDKANLLSGPTDAQQIVAILNGRRNPTSRRMVRRLLALATEAIHALERLDAAGNPHVREVASERIYWPVLTGHHSAILKKNAEWLKDIGLAQNAPNRLLLEQLPTQRTPARTQALHLLELVAQIQESAIWDESVHEDVKQCDLSHLQQFRSSLRQNHSSSIFRTVTLTWPLLLKIKELPLLGPEGDTIARWQEVTLELLSLNTDDNPASIDALRPLGEHRRFHPYSTTIDRELLEGIVSSEQQNKNISREIMDILKDEIRKIATAVGRTKNIGGVARALTPPSRKPR
jgi:hypothetical protein